MNDNEKEAMELAIRELGSSPQYYEAPTDDIFEIGFEAGLEYARRWSVIESVGLPKIDGNYFVTYLSPVTDKNDVVCLYWDGHKWAFPRNVIDKIVLTIIAWKEMPQSFREPYKEAAP